jgi:hypothetical protein
MEYYKHGFNTEAREVEVIALEGLGNLRVGCRQRRSKRVLVLSNLID